MKTQQEIKEVLVCKLDELITKNIKFRDLPNKFLYWQILAKIRILEEILSECGFLDDGEYKI